MSRPTDYLKDLKKDIDILIKGKKYEQVITRLNQFEEDVTSSGILEDISDLQKSKERLAKSEEKFRKLSDMAPVGICIQRQNKYYYVNNAWAEITGYKVEDISSIGPFDILHPEMIEFAKTLNYQKIRKDKPGTKYNLKILTKDMHERWIDVSIAPIFYENRFANIAIFSDITEFYNNREALIASEEKYRSLIENLKHEYIFFRMNTKGYIEYVSSSIQNILGFDPDTFNVHYTEYLTDNPINTEGIEKTELSLLGILQFPFEIEYFDIQKNKHVLEISETPIVDKHGNVTAIEGIAHDITAQKQAEQKLKESENKLRKLNAQKDRFFSLLAHDLRSPIGNFVQISELLKTSYSSLSSDQIVHFFDNLHKIADNTYKLLENLLTWSRNHLGKLDISIEELELYKLVEEVAILFEENTKAKKITLKNNIPKDLMIKADANIVKTIFRNFISNAIKFTGHEGEIQINSSNDRSDEYSHEYIIISVADNGVGIPADKIDKIFSFEDHYSTRGTDNEKGTGLGLNLCKDLIERMGEKIWVGSEIDKGTTFYFTLKR